MFRSRNDKPLTVALLATLVVANVGAQELRHISAPRLTSAIYDPVRERVIAFGSDNYVREWDGFVWRQVPDYGAPAFQNGYVDQSDGTVVMPGPYTSGFNSLVAPVQRRNGNTWTSTTIAVGPIGADGRFTTYDSTRGEFVAFGGLGWTALIDETWTFDGAVWTLEAPATIPPARIFAGMTFDTVRQRVVMYGGGDAASNLFGDTWEWDGTDWQQRTPTQSPPPMFGPRLEYDSTRQTVMLLGNPAGLPTEHWQYDGTTWTQLAPPPVPMQAAPPVALVHDAARAETLAIGFRGAPLSTDDVWAFDGTSWTQRQGLGSYIDPVQGMSGTVAPNGTGILVFGGYGFWPGTTSELARFDGANWSSLGAGPMPGRIRAKMWTQQGYAFLFGGEDGAGTPFADAWRWDGTSWTQMANGPTGGGDGAIAYDPVTDRAIYTTTTGSGIQTWAFDGTNWLQLTTATNPSRRIRHSMAFDPTTNQIVMYGGIYSTPFGFNYRTDTWTFDGTDWQFIAQTTHPDEGEGSLCFDARLQQLVFAAEVGYATDLWRFDGATWFPIPATGAIGGGQALESFGPLAVSDAAGQPFLFDVYGVRTLVPDPASSETYGVACTADAPTLAIAERAALGSSSFGLDVTAVAPSVPILIAAGDTQSSVPVLGCTLLVAPIVATTLTASSLAGAAHVPLAIPANSSLVGSEFFFQAATFSTAAPSGLTFSRGVRITLGN